MTTFNTGNPLGSTDPRDLYDNAENLDNFVNGEQPAYGDRLGVPRKTWHGMEEEFDGDQARRENEHDADQTRRESEFVDAQADKQQRFNLLLANSGYEYLADYAAGIEVTEYNQVIRDSAGELWRVSASTELPYTTDGTGLPEGGAFVAVGDADIRNDLAAGVGAGKGALLVRGAVIYVDTIADLQALDTSGLVDGQQVSTPDRVLSWNSNLMRWDSLEHSGAAMQVSAHDAIWSWWAKPCIVRYAEGGENRTYMTFSESNGSVGVAVFDHIRRTAKRYIISRDFTPDDHNTGAIVAERGRVMVVYPGRRYTAGSAWDFYYIEFGIDEDPTTAQWEILSLGRDYPNAYVCDNKLLLLGRSTPTGENQWNVRLASWPLSGITPAKSFFNSEKTWPYIATRRSRADRGIINFAVGWHPETTGGYADIHVGRIVRHGQTDAWDVESGGATIANLTTGSGLPIDESILEKVYEAPAGELVRLLDVHDDAVAFCRYQASAPELGEYMVAYRNGSTWSSAKVADSGAPFYIQSNYFGGVAIDDDNRYVIWVARESGGKSYKEKYVSEDGGVTFSLTSTETSPAAVIGRPMAEVLSEKTETRGDLKTVFFAGSYSKGDYERFNTLLTEGEEYPADSMSVLASSSDSRADDGNYSMVAASDGSTIEIIPNDIAPLTANSMRARAVIGAINSSIRNNTVASAVMASVDCNINGGAATAIIAGRNCSIDLVPQTTAPAAIMAAAGASASGYRSLVAASNNSVASGSSSAVVASDNCESAGPRSIVIGSNRVRSAGASTVCGGNASSGEASTANRTWQILSSVGNLQLSGAVYEGHNFSDIAKMIQNGEGSEIEPGHLLTLIGEKVYKAREGERVDAIVAATPGIIQNDTPFTWQGRYLLDEWGRKQMQEVEWVEFEGYEGLAADAPDEIPEDAVYSTIEVPIENPEYDPEQENVPRSERPDEWTMAGVHGIIRTRVDASVTQAAVDAAAGVREVLFIEASETAGVGRLAQGETNVQVMAVEKEFDGSYGIAKCLLR